MSKDVYKFLLLGDTGVGKTSLFNKLTKGIFEENPIQFLGMAIVKHSLYFNINTPKGLKEVKIELLDTNSYKKFSLSGVASFFKDAKGLIMIYDITKGDSFLNLGEWLKDILIYLGQNDNYLIILLGNKLDLVEENPEKRQVWENDAKDFCEGNNIFNGGECSVKAFDVERIKALFKEFSEEVYKKINSRNKKGKKIILSESNHTKKKSNC